MKTLRIISTAFLVMLFVNVTRAQVETDEDSVSIDLTKASSEYTAETEPTIQDPALAVRETPSQRGFHIGARYQPTFGKLDFRTEGEETVTADFEVAHGWAGSLNYYFSNYVGMHLEVNGMRQAYEFADDTRTRRVDLSYINIPLLLSLNTNYGRSVNLNITGGPYFGLNTGASATVDDNGNGASTAQAMVDVNPLDIGLAYGAGIDFGIGQTRWLHINVGFRGTQGLLDVGKTETTVGQDQFQIVGERSRMNTYGAYVGLMFRL
ncbi:MAG: PorT family protein [Bacteroidota bacterium]|nr:PorT family protein [Bacteroidota bacterium]